MKSAHCVPPSHPCLQERTAPTEPAEAGGALGAGSLPCPTPPPSLKSPLRASPGRPPAGPLLCPPGRGGPGDRPLGVRAVQRGSQVPLLPSQPGLRSPPFRDVQACHPVESRGPASHLEVWAVIPLPTDPAQRLCTPRQPMPHHPWAAPTDAREPLACASHWAGSDGARGLSQQPETLTALPLPQNQRGLAWDPARPPASSPGLRRGLLNLCILTN